MAYSDIFQTSAGKPVEGKSVPGIMSPLELEYYDRIWAIANPTGASAIPGKSTAIFLKKSGLPVLQLGEIWQISDHNCHGYLDRHGFNVALKLIALAQDGHVPSAGLLVLKSNLPEFQGIDVPSSSYLSPPTEEPKISIQEFFQRHAVNGLLSGDAAHDILSRSSLPTDVLAKIWDLADATGRGSLDMTEFAVALYYTTKMLEKKIITLPEAVPEDVLRTCREATEQFNSQAPSLSPSRPLSGLIPSTASEYPGIGFDYNAKQRQILSHFLAQQEEQVRIQKEYLEIFQKQQQEQARLLQEQQALLLRSSGIDGGLNGAASQAALPTYLKAYLDQEQQQTKNLQAYLSTQSAIFNPDPLRALLEAGEGINPDILKILQGHREPNRFALSSTSNSNIANGYSPRPASPAFNVTGTLARKTSTDFSSYPNPANNTFPSSPLLGHSSLVASSFHPTLQAMQKQQQQTYSQQFSYRPLTASQAPLSHLFQFQQPVQQPVQHQQQQQQQPFNIYQLQQPLQLPSDPQHYYQSSSLYQPQQQQTHQNSPLFQPHGINTALDPVRLASVNAGVSSNVPSSSSTNTVSYIPPHPRAPQGDDGGAAQGSYSLPPSPAPPRSSQPQGPRAPQYREPIPQEPVQPHRAPQAL
ncbi:hypothetical protein EDD21DRAFT_33816 [Dissophora ornata]|nr:hypothetical protein EDD21DRAFT_33816 [Dissophora ornata]